MNDDGDSHSAPYAGLTPERMLDALASIGLHGDGRMIALNSYENRVYLAWLEDGQSVIAKFYRPHRWSDEQILEEHRYCEELLRAEVPAVAPMVIDESSLHRHEGFRFAVFPRRGGRAPELDRDGTLEWIGRYLGRIHAIGATRPFEHRPALDLRSFGTEPRDWLLAHDWLPPELREAWRTAVDLALEQTARCWNDGADLARIRLHGDCHPGNILWTDQGPHFVDFDDCRSGPAIQDLWMLLSGDRDAMTQQLGALLTGYRTFHPFDPRELRLIEPLRTLRLIHYCAWIARRWQDPAFPAAFPWFGTQRYWQDRVLELREQIAALQEPPLEMPPA